MINFLRFAIIKKEEDGYHIYSEKKDKDGKRKHLGGPYTSKEKAKKRLKQIEFFKHKNSNFKEEYIMKSFVNLKRLKKLGIKLEQMLDPESRKKLQDISLKTLIDAVPDYDPKEPLPSSFVIPEEISDELVHTILKALIKYPNIRTSVRNIEFKAWKTRSGRILDEVAHQEEVDPTNYYARKFFEYLKLTDAGVRRMLERQKEFAVNIKHRKARLVEILKTAMLSDVYEGEK